MIIFAFISDSFQALARWITGNGQGSVPGSDGSFMPKGLSYSPASCQPLAMDKHAVEPAASMGAGMCHKHGLDPVRGNWYRVKSE